MAATIGAYLADCDRMVRESYYYDNSPSRCTIGGHGRDCSTFVAFALSEAGYPNINLCNNSFGFAAQCYGQPRPAWFSQKYGPGQGTFISYDQAQTVTCWGFRGSNFGMSPDYTGDGHIETIIGNGPGSVGAHSHATGIGYDSNGINNHSLSFFAVPPQFLPELAPPPVDPAVIAQWIAWDQWRHRVAVSPLTYGARGPDVSILNDLLHTKHFLKNPLGNAYGIRTRTAIYKFKLACRLGNTDGKNFGGTAANALLQWT